MFHLMLLLIFDRFPTYRSNYPTWQRNRLLHYSQSTVQYEDHLHSLTVSISEQDKILEHLEEHFRRVLSAFPKLSTITLCASYWKTPTSFKFALREDSISRQWIRRDQFLPLIKAISNTPNCNISKIQVQSRLTWGRYKFLDNHDFGDDENTPGSIKYCLGFAFDTARYPKEKIPFIYGSALSLTAEEILVAQGIFSNLTHLNLGIYTSEAVESFYTPPKDIPKKYWADFPSVLRSLIKVVDLSLDMKVRREVDQQHYVDYFHDDVLEIFGDFQMPRLKRLRWSQFRSCGSSIESLLLKHPLLRDLSLNFIIEIEKADYDPLRLYKPWKPDPRWIECVEVMRRLKLQRLHLKGIEGFGHNPCRFGSENEDLTLSRIHDYIIYGYGDNPLPTRNPVELNGLEWDRELW